MYRDPVHDFAFFRFDPAELKYMEVTQIKLAPEKAKVWGTGDHHSHTHTLSITHTHTHKVGGGLRVLQTPAFVSGPCVRDPRVRDPSCGGTASGADQRPRMHKFHTSQDPFSPALI